MACAVRRAMGASTSRLFGQFRGRALVVAARASRLLRLRAVEKT